MRGRESGDRIGIRRVDCDRMSVQRLCVFRAADFHLDLRLETVSAIRIGRDLQSLFRCGHRSFIMLAGEQHHADVQIIRFVAGVQGDSAIERCDGPFQIVGLE